MGVLIQRTSDSKTQAKLLPPIQTGIARNWLTTNTMRACRTVIEATYLKLSYGTGRVVVSPQRLPPGTYTLRVRAGAVKDAPAARRFIQIGHPQRQVPRERGLAGQPISSHQVSGTIENPETIEIPLEVGPSTPREFAVQEKQPNNGNLKALWDAHNSFKRENGYGHPPAIWIDWVELEGPHPKKTTESQESDWWVTAETTPDDSQRAQDIFENFAFTAFRGVAAEDDFLNRLTAIYESRRASGDTFEDAIELPLGIILASPGFLYLNEPGGENAIQKGAPRNWTNTAGKTIFAELIASEDDTVTLRKNGREYRIPLTTLSEADRDYTKQWRTKPNIQSRSRALTERELAVRLAYFLWSSPPDQELLGLANTRELSKPDILRQQVDRLIADHRSDEFVAGFVHQWLDMERLDFFQFDPRLYRDFDESTRSAARQEVYHSFAHLLRAVGLPGQSSETEGRIGKLLKSDYVFVNGLLATYYGIEGVTGDEFRKIKLSADSPRGGLLGMAAIHAMGSDGIDSSPVERGAWVLRHLLNDPPPPAPPNVPQISRLKDQALTTRERLLAHQEEAQCSSCHRKIDPIGFGLENFNAAGKWRTEDSYQARDKRGRGVGKRKTWTIDVSGAFHKGPTFNDYHELRDLIAGREVDFARGFTEHLIEYGLGRAYGFTDEGLGNEIVAAARNEGFAVSEFIHALVQSKAFRQK